MTSNRRARLYLAAAVAASLIAAVIGTTAAQKGQDRKMVNGLMHKKTTVCVGRLVLDLPEDAQISYSKAQVAGVTIDVLHGYSQARTATEIAAREGVLAGQLNEYGRPSLEKRQVINAVNFESTILYSGRKKPMTRISRGQPVTSGEGGVTVEAFGNKDDLFYRFIGKNLSSPKYEQNVHELVTRFESRADTSLPLESGFCTENGLVHDPISAEDNETVTMFAALSSHPDVLIRLDTAVVDEPEETLLARHAKNDIAAEFAKNITTLRQGARDLNGLAGEEVLLRVKEANGTTVHSFMWASPGKGADLLAPSITLEMQTGKARPGNTVNSSLSDEAARQLWQDISSSLKIRPVGPAPQKRPAPVPLGELVPTGQPCPHTGYWQCGVTGRASGAQREFIRHGEVMPHVLLHEVPSLWQKLTGRAPLRRAATVWKLVAYDTADGTDKSGTDIT